MVISSPVNPQLKFARRVREGKEPEAIFIEGERLCEEALKSGLSLIVAFHSPDPSPRSQRILEVLRQQNCHTYETTPEAFEAVSDTVNSQGIIIIAQRPIREFEQVIKASSNLIMTFDMIQDPGNAGTMMRTAEAAGVQGLAVLKGTTDCTSPKALRSAMGAAFRLPIIANLEAEQIIATCRAYNITIAATASEGSMVYSDYDWKQPTMVIFGNEANGVKPEILAACDVRLSIPLQAPVESLNVASAAAIILFEAARQRREKKNS